MLKYMLLFIFLTLYGIASVNANQHGVSHCNCDRSKNLSYWINNSNLILLGTVTRTQIQDDGEIYNINVKEYWKGGINKSNITIYANNDDWTCDKFLYDSYTYIIFARYKANDNSVFLVPQCSPSIVFDKKNTEIQKMIKYLDNLKY